MAGGALAAALPAMAEHFSDHPRAAALSRLALTLPSLVTALFAPVAGLVIDRSGRRRVLIASTALYAVAGVTGFFMPSFGWLLVSRAVLGLAVGGVMTATTTLVADYFDEPRRSHVMGLQSATMGFAGVFYLAGGGVLADISWRAPFLLYGLAFLLVPLMRWSLDEPARARGGLDGPITPTREMWGVPALVVSLAFVSMLVFFTIPVQAPFYLRELASVSNSRVGMALGSYTLFGALSSLQYRRTRGVFDAPQTFVVGYALLGSGFWLLSRAHGYGDVVLALVVGGLGMGQLSPNYAVWITSVVPVEFRGRVMGGLVMAFFLGQFFSPIVAEPVVTRLGLAGMYRCGSLVLWGLALAFLVGTTVRKRRLVHARSS